MPQLPTLEAFGQRPDPRPSAAVTEIRPGGVEAAVANAGEAIVAIDDVMTKTRRSLQLSEALGAATERLGEKAIAYERDQDFRTAPTRFRSDANNIEQEVSGTIDDPFVRRLFAERYRPLASAQQLHVTKSAAKQEIDWGKARLADSVGKMAEGMANASDPFTAKAYEGMAMTAIVEMRGTGVISDVEEGGYKDKFYRSYYATFANRDPVAALRDLQQNGGKMDPLTAAQVHQQLTVAARPVLANEYWTSMPSLSFTTITPDAKAETVENLIEALKKVENPSGNPNAVSKQGARGSMQIMEGTFAQYAAPGESYDDEAARVRAAERKVRDDWTFFKGDVRKVAAAYIGGRGGVLADGTLRDYGPDANGVTPKRYAAMVEQALGGLRQSVVNQAIIGPNGMIDDAIRNPSKPTGNDVIDALPLDEKIAVLQMAKTQAQQGQSQVKAAVLSTIQDGRAMLRDGKEPTDLPPPDKVLAALGPDEGLKQLAGVAADRQLGEDKKAFMSMPGADILKTLQQRESELPAGAGYAERKHSLNQLGEAAQSVINEREKNPAGTVLQNSPATRALFEQAVTAKDAGERATRSQEYAASTLGEQERLGIQSRAILTPQQVASVAREFAKPGNDAGQAVAGLEAQWGKYYPQVMRELRKSLPPNAIALGLGMKPDIGALVVEGSKLKPEELQKNFADTDLKNLTDAIAKKMQPFRATVTMNDGGTETSAALSDSVKTAALMMMQQNMKMPEAVDKAFEGILGYKYAFDGQLRVPKAALGGGVTVPAIKMGGAALLRDIADTGALGIPEYQKGMRPEDAEKQWRATLRSTGVWVTSPGYSGSEETATLHYISGSGLQAARDAMGLPIQRSWREMATTATERLPTFMDIPSDARAAQLRGGPGVGRAPEPSKTSFLEDALNAVIPSASAAEKARYYKKDGQLYDAGVKISQQEAEAIIRRGEASIAKNNKTRSGGDPWVNKAADLANAGIQKDIDEIRKALK